MTVTDASELYGSYWANREVLKQTVHNIPTTHPLLTVSATCGTRHM